MTSSRRSPEARSVDRALAERLLCDARLELRWLRRIRGPGPRTARRIAGARARLALAAALLAAPLAGPVRAAAPIFLDPLAPLGVADVGDFSAPAFADVDGDGDLDAFVGEQDGSTIFFENTGTASGPAFAPVGATNPFGLADVALRAAPALADIDGDGDLDAFVGDFNANTTFFANTGTASAPSFAAPSVNPFGLADAGYNAAPTFADIDGDGDLDAFFADRFGTTSLFENVGSASAPAFAPPSVHPFGLRLVVEYAALAFADVDGDGDLDACFGEFNGNVLFLENTGTASAPAFGPLAAFNPFGLVDVGLFARPTFADVDGDGDLDAFVGERYGGTRFFENTGETNAPAFVASLGEIPNLSNRASPTLADLDADGDLDLWVARATGSTVRFENTGTASAPAFFPAQDINPFGLVDVGDFAAPEFADLDGDGDLDAFFGEQEGNTVFFENTGAASAPAFDPLPATNPFGLADVGADGTPAFGDLDGDGDLDLLSGRLGGEVIFFENTGAAATPAFAAPLTSPFGLPAGGTSTSPAVGDLDGDGDLDLLLGRYEGQLEFCENTGTASAPAFVPCSVPFGLPDVGSLASPALADLDGDGDLDAFVGDSGGDTIFYRNLGRPCPPAPESGCAEGFAAASLTVDERKAGKEKLTAKLLRGPAISQPDLGDPTLVDGGAVAFCAYDDAGVRVAALEVDRAGESCGSRPCWRSFGKPAPDGKGFAYKDGGASEDGVKSLSFKAGAEGKSSLACSAGNTAAKGRAALPTGIAAALADAASVTLQVHTSGGACFATTLTEITSRTGDLFKAR